MNKAILVGNLTRDPELSTTTSGINVCKFAIAVKRRFKADNQPEADFFNIVAWRGLADNSHKYLKKGSKVGIVGQIQNRSYDAQDGTKKYTTEIVAEEVEFLNTKTETDSNNATEPLQPTEDDGLPF